MRGFTSGKFRSDDWERLLNLGFTRSGNYFYQRDPIPSCCEVYQYRVDVTKFVPSAQQKKVMRRFYKYLHYGKAGLIQRSSSKVKSTGGNKNEHLEKILIAIQKIAGENGLKEVDKVRVYLNKKLDCISSNVLKLTEKAKL